MKSVPLEEIVQSCSTNYGGEIGEHAYEALVAKVSNITDVGEFHRDFEPRTFTESELQKLKAKPGDLFVVKSSGSKAKILSGKTALVTEDSPSPLVASNFLLLLRPKPDLVESRYLWRVLNSSRSKAYIKTIVGAFTYPNLKWKTYGKHPIPLPPLAEQKRIATILDAADALRAKRRESIAQLDTLLQSSFLDMFGDPVTNTMGWNKSSLSDTRSRVQIGPFGSLLHKEDYIEGGIPLINPMHIVSGQIRVDDEQTVSEEKAESLFKYRLEEGDVVMGRRGEMGRCAIVSNKETGMLCGTGSLFIRVHSEEFTPIFLAMTLSSRSMKRHLEGLSQGVTMPNLNSTMIEKLKIPLPPPDLQCHFATIVESIERQRTQQGKHLTELDNLFASLQQRAFKGEL